MLTWTIAEFKTGKTFSLRCYLGFDEIYKYLAEQDNLSVANAKLKYAIKCKMPETTFFAETFDML